MLAMLPEELTWNCAALPTLKVEVKVEPPTATLPVVVMLSPAVVGAKVVPVRVQNPAEPLDEPVMFPVQVKLPVALLIVQPVAPEPPAIVTSCVPSDCKFKAPLGLLIEAVEPVRTRPTGESSTTAPLLNVLKVKSLDSNDSPASRYNGPLLLIVDDV